MYNDDVNNINDLNTYKVLPITSQTCIISVPNQYYEKKTCTFLVSEQNLDLIKRN